MRPLKHAQAPAPALTSVAAQHSETPQEEEAKGAAMVGGEEPKIVAVVVSALIGPVATLHGKMHGGSSLAGSGRRWGARASCGFGERGASQWPAKGWGREAWALVGGAASLFDEQGKKCVAGSGRAGTAMAARRGPGLLVAR
jgi:hypothetical protein